MDVVTRVRASSNSSVGHSCCCTAAGVARKAPAGSICVACARRAASRWGKYSEHSTWVRPVTLPALQHRPVRAGPTLTDEQVVEQLHALPHKTVGVVELQGGPRLTGLRCEVRVTGTVPGDHGGFVHLEVVRVRVAAVLIVGDDHVWTELPDDAHQLGGDLDAVRQCEAALRQRGERIPLRQAGVDVPEPDVLDTDRLDGGGHLLTADVNDVLQHPRPIHGGVEDVAAFPAGAGHHHDAVALRSVARHGGRPLRGFIIRVRVDRQEAESAHVCSSFLTVPCTVSRPHAVHVRPVGDPS